MSVEVNEMANAITQAEKDIFSRVLDTLAEHGYDVDSAEEEYIATTLRETDSEYILFDPDGVVDELVELVENG